MSEEQAIREIAIYATKYLETHFKKVHVSEGLGGIVIESGEKKRIMIAMTTTD